MKKPVIIFCFTLMMLLLVFLGEAIISVAFPGYTAKAHLAIPVYFWLIYSVAIITVKQNPTTKEFATFFMAAKAVKIVLSLMVLTVMAFVFRSQAKGVILNFLVYYSLMMIPENIFSLYMKRHTKKDNQ